VVAHPFYCWDINFLHTLTGTLSPDAHGDYQTLGLYEGKGYGTRNPAGYSVWWNPAGYWQISSAPGVTDAGWWKKVAFPTSIAGNYIHQGTATGDPVLTVASYPVGSPPMTSYDVTGTLSPDETGNFVQEGTYGGQNYYRHLTKDWYLWWNELGAWMISHVMGEAGTSYWYRESETIEGEYTPQGSATGVATVTLHS
jgi:hypothetical protein